MAFYISAFSTLENYQAKMQAIVVLLFCLEALRCLVVNSGIQRLFCIPWYVFGFCVVVPALAGVAALFSGNGDSAAYAVVYAVQAVAVYICIFNHGFEKVSWAFFISMSAAVLTVYFFEFDALLLALSIDIIGGSAMARFSPFDGHPNLIGHVYGAYSAVCIGLLYTKIRVPFLILAIVMLVLATVLVFASSSRGGLVALLGAAGVLYFGRTIVGAGLSSRFYTFAKFVTVLLAASVLLVVCGWMEYFVEILQLEHSARGLDSGLTGRVGGWPVALSIWMSEPMAVFFGFGFRAWNPEVRGFDIDNSYVTMLFELGVFSALYVLVGIIYALRYMISQGESLARSVGISLSVFFILEGVVNRQMIAIGNPASIFYIFLLLAPWCSGTSFRLRPMPSN